MRLAELRQQHGLSQKDLSTQLGCSQNAISNWENGNRQMDYDMLIKAAGFFNVTIDYLLGIESVPSAEDELSLKRNALNVLFNQMTPEERELLLAVAAKMKH